MITFDDVDRLIKTGHWQQATLLLYNEFVERPTRQIGLWLAFMCWYGLEEGWIMQLAEPIDYDDLSAYLKHVTTYMLEQYGDDPEVLCCFGYMIVTFAWFFSKEVERWEEYGKDLITRAHDLDPDDPIYEMLYLTYAGVHGAPYREACLRAQPVAQQRYPGTGEFDRYFNHVFTRDGWWHGEEN